MLIAELAQGTQERRLDDAHAAFAHDRFDEDRTGLAGDRAFFELVAIESDQPPPLLADNSLLT